MASVKVQNDALIRVPNKAVVTDQNNVMARIDNKAEDYGTTGMA